jgi:N-acetylmuramoyl-L-alanine amidase
VKLLTTIFLFIFFTTLTFSDVNVIKNVEMKKNELVLISSKKFDKRKINQFTLAHPFRRVFDFKNTRLKDIHISKRFPKDIRIAQYKANTVRIVIQNKKVRTCKAYIPMLSDKEYHIPLDASIVSKSSIQNTKVKKLKRSSKSINDIFSEVEMVNSDERLRYTREIKEVTPKLLKPLTVNYSHSNKKDLIVIDAGHGGHDGGATVGGKREKDLVLSIAKKVSKALKRRGYSVYLTRTRDRFLKLSQRTKIADKKGAVAFISIHANSVPKRKRNKIHGIETFFLQTTRDAKSQRIAARENAAVLKGAGSNLSKRVIVDSVLNGPKIIESNKLAIDVQRRIMTNVRSRYKGVKDGGVRHAPFYVLVGASRPSILVEVGYISHPRERKRLFKSSYQNLIANGIAEGVDNYLNTRKREIDID